MIYYDLFYSPNKIYAIETRVNRLKGRKIKSLVIQDIQNGIWATRGYDIYHSSDNGKVFTKKYRIPISFTNIYFIGNSRLLRKLLKRTIFNEIKVLTSGTIIAFAGGKIMRLAKNDKYFKIVHYLRHHGKDVGMGIFPAGLEVDSKNKIYYGEYFKNTKRENVKIFYSSDDAKTWNEFYNFASKEIKHIHGLFYDKYTDTMWVTTGDYNNEVIIGYFDKDSRDLKIVTRGIQEHTAISLLFTRKYVIWGSDTPFLSSYIFRYDRSDKNIIKQKELNSMGWYNLKFNNNFMAISTAVVGSKDKKITDGNSAIWISDNGKEWKKIFEFRRKKKSPIQTQIRFPRARNAHDLIFTVLNTNEHNNGDSFIFKSKKIVKNFRKRNE